MALFFLKLYKISIAVVLGIRLIFQRTYRSLMIFFSKIQVDVNNSVYLPSEYSIETVYAVNMHLMISPVCILFIYISHMNQN